MNTSPKTTDFDAFGDVEVAARPRVTSTRRARKVTVAVFWSIALMLIAGRIYQSDVIVGPQPHAMEIASR